MLADLKLAVRTLGRSPSYLFVAVLTLALGIGATTAIFSVVDGVLLRPLPYRDADRLITIWETAPSFERMSVSFPDYLDWEQQQTTLSDLGCFRNDSVNLTGDGRPERLPALMMSASLLKTLGLAPALGRSFTADEDRPGGAAVAMVSTGFWKSHLAGATDVVGRTLSLGGVPYTIVGVLPADFRIDRKAEIVTPIGRIEGNMRKRGNHPGILAIGRLKDGVTVAQARADLEASGRAIAVADSNNAGVLPALSLIRVQLVKDVRAMLLILMGAVAFVLLVAVANVANLALARGTVRRKEMAVRAALGASRRALAQVVLAEAAVVALAGGVLGVLLALWGVDVLGSLAANSLPSDTTVRVDVGVLAFSLVVSLGAGLLFGLAPALGAARADVHDAMKEGRTVTAHGRTRSALVVAEVALAMILLVGAGLSLRAFVKLAGNDNGFAADQVVTVAVDLPRTKYPEDDQVRTFHEELGRRVRALPGVAAATLSSGLPIESTSETSFVIENRPTPEPGHYPMAVYYIVDGEYRAALGLRLLAGRFIDASDRADGEPVAAIDEHLARTRFAGEDPLGKRISLDRQEWIKIVGVVAHVNSYGLGEPEATSDQFYLPWQQLKPPAFGPTNRGLEVTLRAAPGVSAASLIPAVAAVVAAIDPDQPVHSGRTMGQILDESVAGRRFAMVLLGVFAGIALLLAVVGLYSVMSYVVAQRRHEVGVRIALGARPADVERMVVAQGLRLVAVGLVLGVAGAFALSSVMASILYGIQPTDPLTFVAVAGLLAVAALLASWLPARRAARVDPMVALRAE